MSVPRVVLPFVFVVLMMGKHLSNENDSESVFDSGHKPELVPSNVEDRQTTYPFCAGKGSFQFGPGIASSHVLSVGTRQPAGVPLAGDAARNRRAPSCL